MDPLSIANMAIGLIGTALSAAKNAGVIGSPDWLKYSEAGLYIARQASAILASITSNPTKYDTMTPEEIRTLLMPKTWSEIEQQAMEELAAEGRLPEGPAGTA